MDGVRALIVLAMLGTLEGQGYSEAKRPRAQEKISPAEGQLKKASAKQVEAVPLSYFTGAFTSWDMYGLVFGYQWHPASELQFETRFVRGNTDKFEDIKWTRHENAFGVHQRFYFKDDTWCLSAGFVTRDATFKSHGRNAEIPSRSDLIVRRHDLAFRLALGTQYQEGSFIYGFDWITIENRFLTLSTSHRSTTPTEADAWDRRDTNQLFDVVYTTSIRVGWKF
jgi:hypothetical protein